MKRALQRIGSAAPWLAPLSFAAALMVFGAASPAFSHLQHPVALLGARGEPHALAFNVLAFLAPGALLAGQAIALRSRHADAPWTLRIGLQLALLSALAFALQGALPLDPANLVSAASRLHATAWTAWWVAFAPGALMIARASGRLGGAWMALLVPALVLLGPLVLPAPLAQRLALLAWFGWWWMALPRERA